MKFIRVTDLEIKYQLNNKKKQELRFLNCFTITS